MRRSPVSLVVLPAVLAALLSGPTSAQGGGFHAGDLVLLSPGIPGFGGALLHVDPVAGTSSLLVDTFSTPGAVGTAVFDSYRQRVVFVSSVEPPPASTQLWAVDAAGQLDHLTTPSPASVTALAPTGDGRIYMRVQATLQPFRYLDATNTMQVLMDASGSAPFAVDGNVNFDFRGMLYDPGTNALIIVPSSAASCAGGAPNQTNVRKLPLSADGTRVVGPVTCAQFDVSTTGETPSGISRGPGGQILLVIDTNSNGQEPRLLQVDPVSLAIAPFASNGAYPGAASTNAGSWCSALNKLVILDTGVNVLRSFAFGETGDGSILTLTGVAVSSDGGSGEQATLAQVEPSACAGAWMAYGAGLAGAGGLVPRLFGVGCPDVGASVDVVSEAVVGGASGVVFVGITTAAIPFRDGTLNVGGLLFSLPVLAGGAAGVAGAGSLTIPTPIPADPLLVDVSVFLQMGFLDAAAVKGVSLSKGLRMTVGG